MPAGVKLEKLTTHPATDLRQLEIQVNNLVKTVDSIQSSLISDQFYGWYGIGANTTVGLAPMVRGSTDTQIGTAACVFAIAGVPVIKAIVNTGTAIGAQTVPADTWASYALDIVAAGTITVSDSGGTIAVLPVSVAVGTFYLWDVNWFGYLRVVMAAASNVTVLHSGSNALTYALS